MTATQTAIGFFREHAGYGVSPGETEEQGRDSSARTLAQAEAWLVAQPGFTVEWEQDEDYDPRDFDAPDMPEIGWCCLVTVPDGKGGRHRESLCGITFDGDGYPTGNAYARVVVAELASELMPDDVTP